MVDLAQLIIKADTTDLERGEAALEGITRGGARAEKQMKSFGRGVGQSSKQLSQAANVNRRFGSSIQNASYQVGDFAVQMASGQRATLALAQQLPQLLGGFGVLGAVMGASVAIGGALIPVLTNLGSAAVDFDDALGDMQANTGFLKRELSALKELQNQYVAAVVRGQDDIASSLLQEIGLRGKLLELKRFDQISNIENLKKAVDASKAAADQVIEEAKRVASTIDQDIANTDFARTQGQSAALDALQEYLEANKSITNEAQKQQAELDVAQLQLQEVDRLIREAAGGSGSLSAGLGAAADEASRLEQALQPVANMGRGGDPRQFDSRQTFRDQLAAADKFDPYATDKKKGGGSSPADQFATRLEALRTSLRTEREVLDEWYAEGQDLLAQRHALEILGEQGHREALLDLEREYQERLRGIQDASEDARLGSVADFYGAMSSLAEAGGGKLAKAAAALGGVEATINAYRAANQALADPTVPFWGKAAAWAATLATGLKAVQAISSAGGGGGSAASVTAGAATSPNTSDRRVVQITIPNDPLMQALYGKLVPALNEELENGGSLRLV